jgi:hypothetical protein
MLEQVNQVEDLLENILRLRRAERTVHGELRSELAAVRESLERSVGRSVRQADAARALGITPPSLSRWLDAGEIASVLTPEGRREIPLDELIALLDEVEHARNHGSSRPVARVINDRKRRAAETVDIDRLLPRRKPRGHRAAELQALAYHRLVAERLDDDFVEEARRSLRRWRREGRIDSRWADEWERTLEKPLDQIARVIGADSPRARELRQTSPFAGVLTEQERNRLVHAVEERATT